MKLPIGKVYPNPDQPRRFFDPVKLQELAESIRAAGLQQPITVQPDTDGGFMIAMGERRYRAHLILGLTEIECIVRTMSADELADAAIIENLQRVDITPLEEGQAFQRRLDQGVTLEDLAVRLGVMKFRIRWRIALLRLLPEYQDAFAKGLIEQNQANHLARLGPDFQRLLFRAISEGRCKTPQALRAVTEKLATAELGGATAPLRLFAEPQQTGMFGSTVDPATPSERVRLTAFEQKLAAVSATIAEGFDENEVVIVRKIRRGNAAAVAAELDLLERHIRKLRLALLTEAAAAAA